MGTCIKLVLTLSMLCYSILSLSTHAHTYIYRCLISAIYVWQSLCSSIYVHSHFRYFSTLHSVCNKFSGETLNINLLLCPFFALSLSLFLTFPSFGFWFCVYVWFMKARHGCWQCMNDSETVVLPNKNRSLTQTKKVGREIETYKVNIIFACCACISRQMISHVFLSLLLLLLGEVWAHISPVEKTDMHFPIPKQPKFIARQYTPIWHRHPTFDAHFFISTPTIFVVRHTRSQMDGDFFYFSQTLHRDWC